MNYGTISGIIGALGLVAAGGLYLTGDEPAPVVASPVQTCEQILEEMVTRNGPFDCSATMAHRGNSPAQRTWICLDAGLPVCDEYINERAKGLDIYHVDVVPVKPPPVEMLENGVQ